MTRSRLPNASDLGRRRVRRRQRAKRAPDFESLESRRVLAAGLVANPILTDAFGLLDVSADIRLTFTEGVKAGSGGIRLSKAGGEVVESFNAATSAALRFSGSTLTIDPFWNLDGSTDYFLTIDAGAIRSSVDDAPFAGVGDGATLAFRTDVETRGSFNAAPLRDLFPGTSSEAIGNHSALYVRATFPDLNRTPASLEESQADMADVARFYADNSRGRISLTTTYTPVVTLDFSHQWLTAFDSALDGLGVIMQHVRSKVFQLGFDSDQFDVTVLRVDAPLRAGASWGGGDSVWLAWGGGGTAAHEIGHALDLGHANSITWGGATNEYGNQIDNMGAGGMGPDHWSIPKKLALRWLDSGSVPVNPGSGIYRIYAAEQTNHVVGRRYGLQQTIPADAIGSNPTITLEYRPAQGGDFEDALVLLRDEYVLKYVQEGDIDLGATLGKTYRLPGSDMHITVLARGDGYLDVACHLGPFPDNSAPSARFTASASTVTRYGSVTFTADAIDANGDDVVYRWSFSDGVTGVGRTFTRTFSQATQTAVTASLEVSDRRGGLATLTTTVTAGAAATGTPVTVGSLTAPVLAQPLVAVVATDAFAAEGGDSGTFTISRIGTATTAPLVVNLAWSGTGVGDVVDLPATVTIPAGATSTQVVLTPTNDTTIEAVDQLVVSIVSSGGYAISGQNGSASLQVDDDDTPVVTVEAVDATAAEPGVAGRDSGIFRVSRTGPTTLPLTVQYGLSGTASNGSDFGRLDGQVVIPAGQSATSVFINAIDDAIGESSETVTLGLATFNNAYSVGSMSRATVTIGDAGDVPTVSVVGTKDESIVTEGGTAKVVFTATGGSGVPIVVRYSVGGTATAGVDFTRVSGTITLATGGTRTVELPIATLADGVAENDESITVTIDASPAYTVGLDSSARLAILDPISTAGGGDRVRVSRFVAEAAEAAASPADFFISRDSTHANRRALTVAFSLSGTATPGVDYTGQVRTQSGNVLSTFTPAPLNTVTIPADASGVVVRLTPVDDTVAEGAETIVLGLVSAPGGAVIGINAVATYVVADNDTSPILVGFQSLANAWGEGQNPADRIRPINVVLSQPAPAGGVQVAYRPGGGSALGSGVDWSLVDAGGADLSAMRGVLAFAAGETTKTLWVRVQADRIVESPETFGIVLHDAVGASLRSGFDRHTVTLYDIVHDGLIREERWAGQAPFTSNTWDSAAATYVGFLNGLTTAQGVGNDYSRRLTGVITAPATGQYTFYASGDDAVRLYVGTSDSAGSKQLVASVPTGGYTSFQQWTKYPAQQSAPVALQAGQRYYVEVQQQDGNGGDHVSIGWTGPGIATITPITTAGALPVADNRYVRFHTASSTMTEGQPASQPILVSIDRALDTGTITVDVEVVAGRSTATGGDYSLGSTTITFAAGEVARPLNLSALADAVGEAPETLVLRLANAGGARIVGPALHSLTILDADAPQVPDIRAVVAPGLAASTVVAQLTATPAAGRSITAWQIVAGNTVVQGQATPAFSIDSQGRLRLANPAALPLGAYELRLVVRATDNTGSGTLAVARLAVNGTRVVEERWRGTNVYASGAWTATPDFTTKPSSFESAVNVADEFSRRITGAFEVPTTGVYSFWVAADDMARLTIAPFADPSAETTLASVAEWTDHRAWDASSSQQSAPLTLQAGQRYVLRAYHMEGNGGDHVSVAWSGPGFTRQLMPASAFLPALAPPITDVAAGSNASLTGGITTFTIAGTAVTDAGGSASIPAGGFTRDTTLGLSGTADAGASVSIYRAATFIGMTTAAGDGSWAFTTPVLAEGAATFRAEVVDASGNVAVTGPVTFTVRSQIVVTGTQLVSWGVDGGTPTATGSRGVGSVLDVRPTDQGVVTYTVLADAPFTEQRWSGSTAFTNNSWDPTTATYTGSLTELTTAQGVGDNYSRRITGWITAPATGSYTFFIAGDDDCKLFLSTDATAANKRANPIASIASGSYTSFQQWTRYSSQISAAISLQAGQRYYVEVQQRDGGGADHVSVGWTGPGIGTVTPIAVPVDLLVADVDTGTVQLVSRGAAGATTPARVPLASGGTSPDGRYVVFGTSHVTGFGDGGVSFTDTNAVTGSPATDILVFDRVTQSVRLATAGATATTTRSRQAQFVGFGADGRTLVYTTDYVEDIGSFTAPGKASAGSWALVEGGYPTTGGKLKTTTVRVADLDPTTLSFALDGASVTDKGLAATVSSVTIARSAGSLSFWVQAVDTGTTKAVKLELTDTGGGILVRATSAKYVSGSQANYNWNTGGTAGVVATSATATGYGVSLLEAVAANLSATMRREAASAARDVVAVDLATGTQMLVSHSAAAGNLQSQAGDVRNVTLSADGRFVLFTAADARRFGNAGTAFTDVAPAVTDLFATDLRTGRIQLLSRGATATASAGVAPTLLGTTADGWAVFSVANPTAFGFTAGAAATTDLIAANLVDGTLRLISRASAGAATTSAGVAVTCERVTGGHVYFSAADARAFGFTSDADATRADLFRFAPSTGTLELVSHAVTSPTAALGGSYRGGSLTVSPQGRFVAFVLDMQAASGGFSTSVTGDALFIADMQTGAIRMVNADNAEGSRLSYGAWAGVQNEPRFFSPDGTSFVWQSSYSGWIHSDRSGEASGWDSQNGTTAYVLDLGGGVRNAGTPQTNRLVSHSPVSVTQAAAASVTLVGVSGDGRVAYLTAADARAFGNDGVAFADPGPTVTDVIAVDLATRGMSVVSGDAAGSFGRAVSFRGGADGGTVVMTMGDVSGIVSVGGALSDPNGAILDVIAARHSLLDLPTADDTSATGTATDNVTAKNGFALTSVGIPGREVQLLANGVVVATQTPGPTGVVVWSLANVANGTITYTLQDAAELVPLRLAGGGASSSLTVTVAAPVITRTGATLPAITTLLGTASPAVSTTVTGAYLTAAVTATAPTGFEVSADGVMWGPTATFAVAAGGFTGTLFVRVPATAALGTHAGNVTLTDGTTSLAIAIPPSVVTDEVIFDVAAGQTVTQTLGRSGALTYIKRGAGTLILTVASGHTGATTVEAGTLIVAADDALASSAVTVRPGATLRVDAGVTMRAPSLTVAGGTLNGTGATLLANATSGIGRLTVTSGAVTGAPRLSVSGNGVVTLPSDRRQTVALTALAVDSASGGRLDIGKARIDVAVGGITAATLRAALVVGRNAGAFDGTGGIVTSGGKASASMANPAVGYRVLPSGAASVAWAAYGDANLDGQVNMTDINLMNSGGKYGQGVASGATWWDGDFNYSGGVTQTDITLMNSASLFSAGSYLPAAPAAAVSGTFTISQDAWIALAIQALDQQTKRK